MTPLSTRVAGATKLTKAQIAFLRRVEGGWIRRYAGYTARRGGFERFAGGEATAKKMARLGLIHMPGTPSLGRPSYATLTDAGKAALSSSQESPI